MDNKDLAQVMHGLGELTGAVKAMDQNTNSRLDEIRKDMGTRFSEIRQDMHRMEQAQSDRMNRFEKHVGEQLSEVRKETRENMASMGKRIALLEEEDKRTIANVAKLSAGGGGIGGALVVAAVELAKRVM